MCLSDREDGRQKSEHLSKYTTLKYLRLFPDKKGYKSHQSCAGHLWRDWIIHGKVGKTCLLRRRIVDVLHEFADSHTTKYDFYFIILILKG